MHDAAPRATVSRMTLRERHVIDAFKLLTGPFVLACMAAFGRWDSMAAWLYLALHGTYGVLWVLKSRIFGDRQWERPLTVVRGLQLSVGLAGYWVAPFLITQRGVAVRPQLAAACVALFGFGVFLHFAADMQKHVSLALRPGALFTDGLWSRMRNPNYFGELLIYLSFAALAQHWAPFVILGLIFAVEWAPNMLRKDRSLSRYEGFAEWRARSGILLPRVF